MAVLHDYSCAAHGVFESMDGKCPHGCDSGFVQKVFLKPIGLKTARTVNIDKTLGELAADYRMTDISNRSGAVGNPNPESAQRVDEARRMQEAMQPGWGRIQSGKDGVQQAIAANRIMPDNALSQVKGQLSGPRPAPVASFGSTADIKAA